MDKRGQETLDKEGDCINDWFLKHAEVKRFSSTKVTGRVRQ